jgi:TRAP-type C4-dicarboxylate transport system permease small subunit
VEWLAEWSCRLAVIIMTALVLTQVVLRYGFKAPLVWVEEASIFLMIWMTFVGAGVALRRGGHVAMTIIVERLPRAVARALWYVSHAAVFGFAGVLAWQGWLLALSVQGQRSPALEVSMLWPYMVMPLGAAFMASQIVAAAVDFDDRQLSAVRVLE